MSHPIHPDLRGRAPSSRARVEASAGHGHPSRAGGADDRHRRQEVSSPPSVSRQIHETADAIRALGRRALAVPVDVGDEDAIRNLIERTVSEFGRLDILVNNAGAIWTQPILQTPPKRFDLMGINVRAAYIACYYALPYMVKQQWGHVLTCAHNEHRRIAWKSRVHDLQTRVAGSHSAWPPNTRTTTCGQYPLAAHYHRDPGLDSWKMADRSQWRTPEIVCDRRSPFLDRIRAPARAHQWIDEGALATLAGITTFDHYWCEGKPPANRSTSHSGERVRPAPRRGAHGCSRACSSHRYRPLRWLR
jgi:citronellol/citronellal dehydrogenase